MKIQSPFIAVSFLLASAFSTEAAVLFDLTFADVTNHTGTNWDDPSYGATARSTLQNSLNEFGAIFASNATVTLSITSSQSSDYYASAGSAGYQRPLGSNFYDSSVYLKITAGQDINGAAADGSIDFSFNFAALGYADSTSFTDNIQGLTRHELIHALGMISFLDQSPTNFSRHDTFLYDSAGNPFVTPAGERSTVANLNDPNSYFDPLGNGPNYKIASQGDFSHLMGVMYPYRQSMNADDVLYLETLGYEMIPEPSSAGSILAGFALACLTRRRDAHRSK